MKQKRICAAAKRELARLEEVGKALTSEIAATDQRLRTLQPRVFEALAAVVTGSPEFHSFCAEMDRAWHRLRTLRVVFATAIQSACHGYLPDNVEKDVLAVQPLEERVGYGIDEPLLQRWQSALSRLLQDPKAALPEDNT